VIGLRRYLVADKLEVVYPEGQNESRVHRNRVRWLQPNLIQPPTGQRMMNLPGAPLLPPNPLLKMMSKFLNKT
jgi:hypothetical protein